jgi:hypothetical protein
MKNLLCLCALSAMLLVSCSKDALVGSGNVITQIRTLDNFDNVFISGNREVIVTKSNEYKVEITGYENLVKQYKEELSNGNLSFGYPSLTRVKNDNINLKIFMPELSLLTISGNARINIGQGLYKSRLDLHLSGNPFIEAGQGNLQLLRIDASGNSEMKLRALQANMVDLKLSGNPYVEVYATERLSVDASGAGKVKYWGSPLTTDINLSGRVKVERQ